jgi:hypothetical protein
MLELVEMGTTDFSGLSITGKHNSFLSTVSLILGKKQKSY